MITKTPKVNQSNEFKEIANDFTNPLELVREAISNSFDANSTLIQLSFEVVDLDGEDVFKVDIYDNGDGMNETDLESFFDLGNSSRRNDKSTIGEKGHGTKVYFNSRDIHIKTIQDGQFIEAQMSEIYKTLNRGEIPNYSYEIRDLSSADFEKGTLITVYGYNLNKLSSFTHEQLKDYILWKTKFGAIDKEFGIDDYSDIKLSVKGLDSENFEELSFGHVFPKQSESANKLYDKYQNEAPDYFCKRWIEDGTLPNFPHIKYQAVFYVEGKKVKYGYNNMISRQRYQAPDGSYTIQDRYGLWLCKDFIPIQRKNDWIVSKGSEYTKFHAFFNCQNFKLTANRGSVENTTPEILQDIESVVVKLHEKIISSDDYALLDWLQGQAKGYQTVNKEKKEYDRRKKAAFKQKLAIYKETKLFEPQLESGVYALLVQLSILKPGLFPFEMIDYNTNTGIDILVKEKNNLTLEQSRIYYVELKRMLDKDFNHSFEYLHSIICWDTKLADGDEINDIQGNSRILKIANPEKEGDVTRYFLDNDRSDRKIEIYVLCDYLKEKLGIEFRPRLIR